MAKISGQWKIYEMINEQLSAFEIPTKIIG